LSIILDSSDREYNTAFSWLIAEQANTAVMVDADAQPENAIFVSGDYFKNLGINAIQGRVLGPQDDLPGASPVLVLGYDFWLRRFAGDPSAIGRVIRVNGRLMEIAGIAPPGFQGLTSQSRVRPALWFAIAQRPYLFSGTDVLRNLSYRDTVVFGKLMPGMTQAAAQAHLASLSTAFQNQHPEPGSFRDAPRLRSLTAVPRDALGPVALAVIMVVLVLLAACSNIANMLLARGQARQLEIDIRIALGAGRTRIIRQLLTEYVLLAGFGCAGGLAVAHTATQVLLSLTGQSAGLRISTDWRLAGAAAMLTLFTACVFGMAPLAQALQRKSKLTRTRQMFVAVQIAASIFLLVIAMWLTHGAERKLAMTVSFDYAHMFVVNPMLYNHGLEGASARAVLDEIGGRLARVPGVSRAALAISPPLGEEISSPGLPRMNYNEIEPSYFELMNLRLSRGQVFSSRDKDVVVISESAARTIWLAEDPIGKTISVSRYVRRGGVQSQGGQIDFNNATRQRLVVIGIVQDIGPAHALNVYVPISDARASTVSVVVQTNGSPGAVMKQALAAVARPGLVSTAWLVQSNLEHRSGPPAGVLLGVTALGATATLLAGLGIFGLIAYAVANRTKEIGIRMALGARASDVIGTLVAQYTLALSGGAATGIALAQAAALLIGSRVEGLRKLDLGSYSIALAVFGLVSLAAVLIPARRALRIDPAKALHWE
jgi:predicted permease